MKRDFVMSHIINQKFPDLYDHDNTIPLFFKCLDGVMETYNLSEKEALKEIGLGKLKIEYVTPTKHVKRKRKVSLLGLKGKYILRVINNKRPGFKVNGIDWRYTRHFHEEMYSKQAFLYLYDPRISNTDTLAKKLIEAKDDITSWYFTNSRKTINKNIIMRFTFDDRISVLKNILPSDDIVWRTVTLLFDEVESGQVRSILKETAPSLSERYDEIYESTRFRVPTVKDVETPQRRKLKQNTNYAKEQYEKGEYDFVFDLWNDNVDAKGTWKWRAQEIDDHGALMQMYLRDKYDDISCFAVERIIIEVKYGKRLTHSDLDEIKKLVEGCHEDKRFVCAGLSFLYYENNVDYGAHANALIFDTEMKSVELFEPHGSGYGGSKIGRFASREVYDFFGRFFRDEMSYKFIRPNNICPRKGPQSLENKKNKIDVEGGYCLAWSLWYMDMRLKYADIPRDVLMKSILEIFANDDEIALGVIRNYAEVLTESMEALLAWTN